MNDPKVIRTAVVFVCYGPPHVARARALKREAVIEPTFVELAAAQNIYPWATDKTAIADGLITLSERPYEDSAPKELRRALLSSLESMKPDAVAITGYSEGPMRAGARWARINGKALILMFETTQHDRPRRWWLELGKRLWIRRNVGGAFVGGRLHRHYLINLGLPTSRVWEGYDVVDNDYFTREAEKIRQKGRGSAELGLPSHYFLYVGRFAPEKNLDALLKAYGQYRRADGHAWGLVLVGDGPSRKALEDLALEENLLEVVWPGLKTIEELPLYYALGGCFVLPSRREPWGLVVNEAMASGLPVLVSQRCGCVEELVREGQNGFVFDPNDPAELAALMARIAALPEARRAEMGKASQEIVSGYTPETWAKNLTLAIKAAVGAAAR